jgi:hypothetical protein
MSAGRSRVEELGMRSIREIEDALSAVGINPLSVVRTHEPDVQTFVTLTEAQTMYLIALARGTMQEVALAAKEMSEDEQR